jgi:four helix bundle protein
MAKKTIGEQLVRSMDSVAGNIVEAEGRHFKTEILKNIKK